jgi:DNA mismatch endonuclease (patch repair protein)
MSRVRNRDTDIESIIRSELHRRGYRFRKHVRSLPGTPDVAFPTQRVAVFVDGDFWHGYRYPLWRERLAPFWQQKIETNRARDRRNSKRLRMLGWHVVRIWQHQVEHQLGAATERIVSVVDARRHG